MSNQVAISHFKSHCLKIIDELQISGQDVIITKRDKAIAKVIAIQEAKISLFGLLKSKAEIRGDILSSIDNMWDVERE